MDFDPVERAKEKQASRDQDDLALKKGKISPKELGVRNSFFPPEMIKNAKIVKRRLKLFQK